MNLEIVYKSILLDPLEIINDDCKEYIKKYSNLEVLIIIKKYIIFI